MQRKQIRDNELYESRFGFKERNSNFLFALVLLLVFVAFLFGRLWFVNSFGGVEVWGSSMRQTLSSGDQLLMHHTSERYKAERGDVIVIKVSGYEECSDVDGGHLIKRLIATEGEWVRCTDGIVEISKDDKRTWETLDEPYAYYGVNDAYKQKYDFAEYYVDDGEVFFLGDNRSSDGSSVDSRFKEGKSHLNGLYKEEDIVGVVPDWAISYKGILSKLFFPENKIKAKEN